MSKIPTAEAFFDSAVGYTHTEMCERAIEFAKLHVEAALKEVLNNTENWDDCKVIPVEKVLNAYPLENVK